jgi:hypothetical protein
MPVEELALDHGKSADEAFLHVPPVHGELGEAREHVACFPGAHAVSVDPGWVYEDAVAADRAIGADRDQLESDLSGAADDKVGLLLFAVACAEGERTPGPYRR